MASQNGTSHDQYIKNAQLTIQEGLKAIENNYQLRNTVSNVFRFLCKDNSELKDENKKAAGNQAFLKDFQDVLSAVNKDFNEVEKIGSKIQVNPDIHHHPLSWCSLDATLDKSNRYRETITIHQWLKRMQEFTLEINQSLNKFHSDKLQVTYKGKSLSPVKVLKYKSVCNPKAAETHITNMIKNILRQQQVIGHMVEQLHVRGNHRVLKISVGRVFVAYIVLWHLNIDRVIIKGFNETILDKNGEFDLDSMSVIPLFRKINNVITNTLLQHDVAKATANQAQPPDVLGNHWMLNIVKFILQYRTLWTEKCAFCGELFDDEGDPPFFRQTFRLGETFHFDCRPRD